MSGEPQPGGGPDKLNRAVFSLKAVWFGLLSGALVITVMGIAVVFSNDQPMADLGELSYLFLLAVPVGLFAAFVVAPKLAPKDPAAVAQSASGRPNGMFDGWVGTKPDEAYYWFPVYVSSFMVRAALLEVTALFCAMTFLMTANWALLGGAVLMTAVLATQIPTRSAAEAFAADARQRQQNAG